MCMDCELRAILDDEALTKRTEDYIKALIEANAKQTEVPESVLAGFFARHFQRMTVKFVEENTEAGKLALFAETMERLYEIPEDAKELARRAFDTDLN